jgi:hypothetical protein
MLSKAVVLYFQRQNMSSLFWHNFLGNRTAKGTQIDEQTCTISTGNSGTNFEESLAQSLKKNLAGF